MIRGRNEAISTVTEEKAKKGKKGTTMKKKSSKAYKKEILISK